MAESWNFAVVGCDSGNMPKYLGFTQDLSAATVLQKNMVALGWNRVSIFDASLKEVKPQEAESAKTAEVCGKVLSPNPKDRCILPKGHPGNCKVMPGNPNKFESTPPSVLRRKRGR